MKNSDEEIDLKDFENIVIPTGKDQDGFRVIDDKDVELIPEGGPALSFSERVNELINSSFQAVSNILMPPVQLDSKKTTGSTVRKYIRHYAKDTIIIGSSIIFLYTNPIISLCIATAISASAFKLQNNVKENFWVGIGLYSAAVFSFFTNPLLTLGLGWGCSVASTMVDVLTVTVLGINIPGAIYGPALLLSDLWVGRMGRAYVKKISEENFLGQMFKVVVRTGVKTLDQQLTNRGEQYFEAIGGNYIEGVKNLISSASNSVVTDIISKYYNKYRNIGGEKLEKEFIIVESEEKDSPQNTHGKEFEHIHPDEIPRLEQDASIGQESGKYTQLVGGPVRRNTNFVSIVRSGDTTTCIQK